MTRITVLATALLLVLAPLTAAQLSTLTQSVDNVNVVMGNSIACQNGFGFTSENNLYRAYNTTTQGLFSPFSVTAVRFGVENVFSLDGAGIRMTMCVHADPTPGDLTTVADLVTLAEESFILGDQALTIVERQFACPPVFNVNGTDDLVIELVNEDGRFNGRAFFVGSNVMGETSPSFIAATACGIANPVDMQSLQPAGAAQHNIIDAVIDPTAMAGSATIYNGTCEDLSLFSSLNGGTAQDGPGSDVQTMIVGDALTLQLISPGGTFDNSGYLILGTPFPTNLSDGTDVPELNVPNPIPMTPPLDSLYLGAGTTGLVDSNSLPFGLPQQLPAGGLSLTFLHPGGALSGNSVLLQGLVVAPFGGAAPLNAFYASTNGTEVVFQ